MPKTRNFSNINNLEINKMDKMINKGLKNMNDIPKEELKNILKTKTKTEPSPIMFFNVLKGKNKLKIHKEGKTILLDSGSSHSIITKPLVEHLT